MVLRRQKLHALILSRKNSGEADRRVTCFTKEHGILPAIAKGVRKIPSRRGGHIEPFTHILGIFSGTAEHCYLAAVETVDQYPALRQDWQNLYRAEYMAQVLRALLPEGESQPDLFDALHHAWQIMPTLPGPKCDVLETAILLYMLQCAGIMPDLASCAECRISNPIHAIVLDNSIGGWRCLECHASFVKSRTSVTPRLLKVLRFLADSPAQALKLRVETIESEQVRAAIYGYLEGLLPQTRVRGTSVARMIYGA